MGARLPQGPAATRSHGGTGLATAEPARPRPRSTRTSRHVPSATLPPPEAATRGSLRSQARLPPSRDRTRRGRESGAGWPGVSRGGAAPHGANRPSATAPRPGHPPRTLPGLASPRRAAPAGRRQGRPRHAVSPHTPRAGPLPAAAAVRVPGRCAPLPAAAAVRPRPLGRARPCLLVFVFFPPATRAAAAPRIGWLPPAAAANRQAGMPVGGDGRVFGPQEKEGGERGEGETISGASAGRDREGAIRAGRGAGGRSVGPGALGGAAREATSR